MYIDEEILQKLGDYIDYGNEYRFYECPLCGYDSHTNPAFSVNTETGVYFCHYCNKGGHIGSIIDVPVPAQGQYQKTKNHTGTNSTTSSYLYCGLDIDENSISAKYLLSRGIKDTAWKDLDYKLKEKADAESYILIYPFIDETGSTVAVQRTFLDKTGTKSEKRYEGKKSSGAAILKNNHQVIVAEGLETGLSVKQYLKECFNENYGLIIAGDAGNLTSLADSNAWVLEKKTKIIIAADNDENEVGQKAAKTVYMKFYPHSRLYIPLETGKDWNDLLREKRIQENWL